MPCPCRERRSRSSDPTSRSAPTPQGNARLELPAAFVRAGKVQIKVDALGLPSRIIDVELTPGVPATTMDVALSLGFEEAITVGTRSIGAEAQKAVPVDVITQEQIASTGYAETAQVIQALAPSFNFPRPTITDGTDTVRPATLRGLGPDQVLVLVNRKRRHPERAGASQREHRPRIHKWTSTRFPSLRLSASRCSATVRPRPAPTPSPA